MNETAPELHSPSHFVPNGTILGRVVSTRVTEVPPGVSAIWSAKMSAGIGPCGLGTRREATAEDVYEAEARLGELDVELRRAVAGQRSR